MNLPLTPGPIGARNVRFGLVAISVGLVMGLGMSLYAFVPLVPRVPAALDDYADLGRRMIRLAHIAAIMLPLLNVVFGLFLDGLALGEGRKLLASRALRLGAALVPVTLAAQGLFPELARWHLPALPILAFCAGTFLVSAGAWRWGALDGPLVTRGGEPAPGCAFPWRWADRPR